MTTQQLIDDLFREGVPYAESLNSRIQQVLVSMGGDSAAIAALFRDYFPYASTFNSRLRTGLELVGVSAADTADLFADGKNHTASLNERLLYAFAHAGPSISFTGTIAEGATTGRAVGTATLANPPVDIGTLTWSELGTGTGAALFAINSSTGAVTNSAALDYETATSYTYGIQVTDGVYTYTLLATISVTNVLEVTLSALTGTFTLTSTDTASTVAGAISGKSSGSTLALIDSGGAVADAGGRVAISGTNIVAGAANGVDGQSYSFTIRETHADGSNSPRYTTLSLSVSDAPALLPTLTTSGASYYAAYSTARRVSGYSGALAKANIGGTQTDLAASADEITFAEISTLRASGPNVPIETWYDQTGNARHMSQSTSGLRPTMLESVTVNGKQTLCFGGQHGSATSKAMNANVTLSSNDRTIIRVWEPMASMQDAVFEDNNNASEFQFINKTNWGLMSLGTVNNVIRAPSVPQVMIVVFGPSGSSVFLNGVKTTFAANENISITNIAIATNSTINGIGPGSFTPTFRCTDYVAIDKAINDTDAAAISAALMSDYSLSSSYATNIVHIGDSITQGSVAVDTQTIAGKFLPNLTTTYKYWNMGIGGKTLTSMYADRANVEGTMLASGKNNLLILDGGINDLHTGTKTGSSLYTLITDYVTWAQAQGWTVAVCTILPESAVNGVATETERNIVNPLIVANTAGADFIIDRASDATMGSYANTSNATYYADLIHPTAAGNNILGPYYSTAINTAFP